MRSALECQHELRKRYPDVRKLNSIYFLHDNKTIVVIFAVAARTIHLQK